MNYKLSSIVFVATFLFGCSLTPEYTQPEFSAADQWSDITGYESLSGDALAAQTHWMEFFDSSEFHLVISTALKNNRDLRITALNIQEARARYRIQRADLLPDLNANGLGTISKSSDESSLTGSSEKSELYEANIGIASYELDLFGKIRSNSESAVNSYLATQEAHAVLRNALIAETANAYLQLLANQKLLSLTRKTLKAQQNTYNILSKSLEKGAATLQDVARASTAVRLAEVNLHQYSRLVTQDKNALFLLMGIPQSSMFLPEITLDDIKIKNNLDSGLPSKVLLARPDIRQAEFELRSRNADIGAARAAFFPSISLTGSYGFASRDLDDLFSSGAGGAWSFLPRVNLPIFNWGRNQANLDIAEIRKEKAINNYEKVIQIAFREVSDELAARETLDKQLEAQRLLVSGAQTVYDLSEARYNSGIDSFLSVLDAQRELYTYQQQEIQVERQRIANLVNLFKVLGGGSEPKITAN